MCDINTWIKERTFHHSQFSDIKQMVELKEKKNLSISLCIPTLNEEATIGKEIIIFNSELMIKHPLLDEIAVIDSGSTDKTLEVAATYGADTYLARKILSDLPERIGKGENLWKAIYQLKGDIIIYLDADIKNIHPRFVYGLVAPLLLYDEVQYVKAFYDRPLSFSEGIRTSGGGRVTEILIRPLFSLFFPELSAIVQPLSGEYAVRRKTLESIPFPIGYGVETAHIIDVYNQFGGINVFAQTDLDMRIHRNQPTSSLGKMSFGILQTFLNRTKDLGILSSKKNIETTLRQFIATGKEYKMVEHDIIEYERPPMNTIEAYQQKFGKGTKH